MYDLQAYPPVALNWVGWLISGIFIGAAMQVVNECPFGILFNVPLQNKKLGWAAALTVFAAGWVGVLILTETDFMSGGDLNDKDFNDIWFWVAIVLYLAMLGGCLFIRIKGGDIPFQKFLYGLLIGGGFMVSGILRQTKIWAGFSFHEDYFDPHLLIVIGVVIAGQFIFKLIFKGEDIKGSEHFENIGARFFVGAGLAGFGLGIGGLGVTSGVVDFFWLTHTLFWLVGFALGRVATHFIEEKAIKSGSKKPLK